MKNLRRSLIAIVAAAMLTFTTSMSGKGISEPKGFDKKVYHAAFALSATSVQGGVELPRFLCTVTAYKKVKGGYLLLGAGHCTSLNAELPEDLKYFASDDIYAPVYPIQLVLAELGDEVDYAVYFYPTTRKYETIELGDERQLKVGDKTVDVNFSLGVAKIVSPGIISTMEIPQHEKYFMVQEFDSHGASGSAVVSEDEHKIVGIVIAGFDGATMPTIVESISNIEAAISKLPKPVAKLFTSE